MITTEEILDKLCAAKDTLQEARDALGPSGSCGGYGFSEEIDSIIGEVGRVEFNIEEEYKGV